MLHGTAAWVVAAAAAAAVDPHDRNSWHACSAKRVMRSNNAIMNISTAPPYQICARRVEGEELPPRCRGSGGDSNLLHMYAEAKDLFLFVSAV